MNTIKQIKGSSVYKIMPVLMKQIVFTKKEVEELSGVSKSSTSKIIEQLVKLGIISPDSSHSKKAYKYTAIYDVFVGKDLL